MAQLFTAAIVLAMAPTFLLSAERAYANQATVTGLDKLHAQAREGGRTCMTEHEHGGEGSLPSKKGASEAAARHWESFTVWEYGKAWGSYRLAAGKKMECAAGGAGWVCKTAARPCRN